MIDYKHFARGTDASVSVYLDVSDMFRPETAERPFNPLHHDKSGVYPVSAHLSVNAGTLSLWTYDPQALRLLAARANQAADMLAEAQRADEEKKAAQLPLDLAGVKRIADGNGGAPCGNCQDGNCTEHVS